MKLKAEEVVEAIARLDHENKQKFANILVTKWSTLLPVLHGTGVMLVIRRCQRQPHIEIRQISDGAQGSRSSNKPALLNVTPCCCKGA